jgi:CheY-like chemotaxis protein
MGYVELCRDELGPSHPVSEWLEEISQAAHRSASITRQLLAFARKQTITPKVIDLNTTISGMLKLLRRMIGENIDLIWSPSELPWPVKMDPGQIDQILANLFVNARDAIDGVGTVTIETRNITITSEDIKADNLIPPGRYVLVTVADDGCGMDEQTLKNIFNPFFTTKEVGKGTGLGLSTLYGIIKQNNGFVKATSKKGEGTTFHIYLPRFISAIEANSNSGSASVPAGGTETILLAEDEKSVREVARLFLEKLGYTVLVAEHPDEALKKASEHQGTIHLLISDVIMPGMSGPDLAEKLAEIYPEMENLFISGYSANVIVEKESHGKNIHFLAKPFTCETLASKIRDIIRHSTELTRSATHNNML